jgi:small basic protein
MTLPEFGWKLCVTAAFSYVVCITAVISMLFVGDRLGLAIPLAIIVILSEYLAVLGAIIAIVGHFLNWHRRRRIRTRHDSN